MRYFSLRFSIVLIMCMIIPALAFAGGAQEGAVAPATGVRAELTGEAPELAEMVAAGRIPPVAERLPEDPFVVEMVDGIGQYGGTWRRSIRNISAWAFWGYVIKENELRYNPEATEIVPVIFKDYDQSADMKTFTFYLRPGMKWSDGEPMDADDYLFWWENIIQNADVTPAAPNWLLAGGKLPEFRKIDQYTIQFTFSEPYGIFLHTMAQPRFGGPIVAPSHYLKQFHPAFASEAEIRSAMEAEGFATWMDLFGAKRTKHLNPDLPGLEAWIPMDDNTGAIMRFRRNPYYWKVDADGNQLPYIDRIDQQLVQDAESAVLKALAKEVDFQFREITGLDNYPLFRQTQGLNIVVAATMHSNIHTNFLNYTIDDPIKAELFADFRFRQALSLAIDRDQINTLLHKGLSAPAQLAPPAGDPAREEEVAKIYTEFDIDRANQLLDEIGLRWDANRRWRLGPDGRPLQFTKIFYVSWPNNQAEAQDLIKQTWEQIGINVINRPVERSLWSERMQTNDYEMSAYATNTGGGPYLPIASAGPFPINAFWYPAPQWGQWLNTGGRAGIEPPEEVKRSFALYEEYITVADDDRMIEIAKEAFRMYSTNLWAIGVGDRPAVEVYYVATERMKNVPIDGIIDDVTPWHPAQFYLDPNRP